MKKLFKLLLCIVIVIVYIVMSKCSNWFMVFAFDEDEVALKGLIFSLIVFVSVLLIIWITTKKMEPKISIGFNIACLAIAVGYFALWFYRCIIPMTDLDRMIADQLSVWFVVLLMFINISYVAVNTGLLIKTIGRLKRQNK